MPPYGINQHLTVEVCSDPDNARNRGYDYRKWDTPPTGLLIEKVVIVRNGTKAGRSTVDLVLVDQAGNRYVTMVTASLLKALPLGEERSGFETLPDDFETGDY